MMKRVRVTWRSTTTPHVRLKLQADVDGETYGRNLLERVEHAAREAGIELTRERAEYVELEPESVKHHVDLR